MVQKLHAIKRAAISLAALLVLWQAVVLWSGVNPTLFPSPLKVFAAWGELAVSGLAGSTSDTTLFGHILASLERFFIGYLLAAVVAVFLGLLLGWFSKAFGYVNPVVQLLRPVAPVAWQPFLVLLIGIGDLPAIAIIFIAGFFPILLSTVTAVKSVDPLYLKVGRNFGLSHGAVLAKLVFPAAFPQIIAGLRQALSTCWIFLVSGEMIGCQSGLGFLVMDAKNCIRIDALLAAILTIGVIGLILNVLISLAEKAIAKKWGFGIVQFQKEEGR